MFASLKSVVALGALAVSSLAVPVLEKKAPLVVWNPEIYQPTADTVWSAGSSVTVTWDAEPPSGGEQNKGMVVLAERNDDGTYKLHYEDPLADSFLLTDGEVDITIPEDTASADNWMICLFGNSGNLSPEFQIIGYDGASSSAIFASGAAASGSAAAASAAPSA